jgi:predicted NBD/HSP70 family sugar kinase
MVMRTPDGSTRRLLELVSLDHLQEQFGFDPTTKNNNTPERGVLLEYLADILARAAANLSVAIDVHHIAFGGLTVNALGNALIDGIQTRNQEYLPFTMSLSRSPEAKAALAGLAEKVLDEKIDTLLT